MLNSASPFTRQLVAKAQEFFRALATKDYDAVWNQHITSGSVQLLTAALWPLLVVKLGKIDELLAEIRNKPDLIDGLSMSIGLDAEGSRTGFFDGIEQGMQSLGWYAFRAESAVAIVNEPLALLMADTDQLTLLLPFERDIDGELRIDFAAMSCFSMELATSKLLPLAKHATDQAMTGTALSFYELAASLAQPYWRLRSIMLSHPLPKQYITVQRQEELEREIDMTAWAKNQALQLLATSSSQASTFDIHDLMKCLFSGYEQIISMDISDDDLRKLYSLNDSQLRNAIAHVIRGIDPAIVQREANKPHSPAEIADMELQIHYAGSNLMLCMPFKSGMEIHTSTVPVEISYQITRPFIYLPGGCVVIFISAKPCSQYLLNYIKVARSTQGWAIEVIENAALAALLKINNVL